MIHRHRCDRMTKENERKILIKPKKRNGKPRWGRVSAHRSRKVTKKNGLKLFYAPA